MQGYGRGTVKLEEEDRHMNVNVSSSGQGTKTVILQIPKVRLIKKTSVRVKRITEKLFRTSSKMSVHWRGE